MNQGVKRPISAYLLQGLWTLVTFYWSTNNSTEIVQWTFRVCGLYGLVALAHMMIKSRYIQVTDNKLVLNDSVFRKTTIDLDQIEKFDFEPGPFVSSKIILKDKTKVKYTDSQTDFEKLKEFMGQYNIPVE